MKPLCLFVVTGSVATLCRCETVHENQKTLGYKEVVNLEMAPITMVRVFYAGSVRHEITLSMLWMTEWRARMGFPGDTIEV